MSDGMFYSYTATPESVTLDVGDAWCDAMVDGDYTTYYSARWLAGGREVGLDLGQERNVSGMRLACKAQYGLYYPLTWQAGYDLFGIWYSNDNANWTHLADYDGSADCPLVDYQYDLYAYFDITFPSTTNARYFKIHINSAYFRWYPNRQLTSTEIEGFFPLDLEVHMEAGSVVARARPGYALNLEGYMEAQSTTTSPILGLFFQAFMEARSSLGLAHLSELLIAHFEAMSVARRSASAVTRELIGKMEGSSGATFTPMIYKNIQRRILEPLGNILIHVLNEPFGQVKLISMLQACGVSSQILSRISLALSGDGVTLRKRLMLELATLDDIRLRTVIKNVLESGNNIVLQIGTVSGGAFSVSDVITGGSSGATGTITDLGTGWIEATVSSGTFVLQETISNPGAVSADIVAISLFTGQAVSRQVYYNIYLDGVRVTDRLTGASVDYSQDSTHNQVTLESGDEWLYHRSKPDGAGISRITIQVGSREMYFLVEERRGDEKSFTITGRSLSAVEDDPYKESETWRYDDDTLASLITEDMIGDHFDSATDWQSVDWVIPHGFEFEGTGIQGVINIAQEVGAIVRANDAGDIIIRPQYPVRPINMASADPDVSYDRTEDIIELSYTETPGTGHNAVTVYGYSPYTTAPDVEVEEPDDGTRDVGDTAYVRVYWPEGPPDDMQKYLTNGQLNGLPRTTEREIEEIIEFHDGNASASKPIHELISLTWLGEEPDGYNWDEGSKELSLVGVDEDVISTQYKVAEIKYKTRYWRYEVIDASVAQIILALEIPKAYDTTVKAIIDSGDKELDDIDAPLLTTQEAALARAKFELDDVRYLQRRITIRAPYDDRAIDGNIAFLDDGRLSLSGNTQIMSVKIIFDGPMVTNEVECLGWDLI